MNPTRPKVVLEEPVPELIDEATNPATPPPRPVARIRVPLTLTVQPWATLYRLPDGRRWWCVRLRDGGLVQTRCVTTDRLRAYARVNRLREMERALDEALTPAEDLDATGG
jgi:hypothetical protein